MNDSSAVTNVMETADYCQLVLVKQKQKKKLPATKRSRKNTRSALSRVVTRCRKFATQVCAALSELERQKQ